MNTTVLTLLTYATGKMRSSSPPLSWLWQLLCLGGSFLGGYVVSQLQENAALSNAELIIKQHKLADLNSMLQVTQNWGDAKSLQVKANSMANDIVAHQTDLQSQLDLIEQHKKVIANAKSFSDLQ